MSAKTKIASTRKRLVSKMATMQNLLPLVDDKTRKLLEIRIAQMEETLKVMDKS